MELEQAVDAHHVSQDGERVRWNPVHVEPNHELVSSVVVEAVGCKTQNYASVCKGERKRNINIPQAEKSEAPTGMRI